MNDGHDASGDFSLERQRRAGRASARDKGDDESIATAPNKPSSAEVTVSAFPDRIRRKYYVVASKAQKDGSDREAWLYADERKEYLAFKATDDRLVTRIAAAEVIRKLTSNSCRSARQPNPGRDFTYRCGDSVQTIGTSSVTPRFEDNPTVATMQNSGVGILKPGIAGG